ncbi:PP2C family protein-serine/threonine phosphatase [Streptomyces sp. WAC07094]|uniref:PP2C family protein-serine/threonine phosphatase n=1 Tax=Streptomyces sp. WAC07094 TaxID=3072183 RepID=UPI002EB5CD49|nr:PP2C family protein-serine/threonine phosphatase [Streptomyces sp. WAC07094]
MSSPVRHGPATAASVAPVVGISVIALVVPTSVHLGSLLIAAPILVAALSTARWTGGAAALSLLAAMICDIRDGLLHSAVMPVHAAALLAVSVFLVATCRARERVRKEAGQLRAISEATQHVVLRPLPRRIANLRVATAYRAAESLARVGGDLYAAARTPYGTRLIIGDVKGKGLRALDDAAALLGAFREAAHQHAALPDLAAALERSVRRHVAEASHTDADAAERFVTALLVEFPGDGAVMRTVSCGHPPPLLLRDHRITTLSSRAPAPPLGLASLDPAAYRQNTVACAPYDVFLLYTDGLAEARDASGGFYALADRGTHWHSEQGDPEALLRRVLDDLVRHTGGRLDDDVALVAVQCAPTA